MKKVYESIEPASVGLLQSILESEGIATLVKNMGAQTGAGEIPFQEVWPELWVVEDADEERARAIIATDGADDGEAGPDWKCPQCGETVEGSFACCWNCDTARPE